MKSCEWRVSPAIPRGSSAPGGQFARAGFITGSVNNTSGKQAELDEYVEASHIVGKFLLRDGKVLPPELADPNAGPAAKAPKLPGTFGASEPDLIAAIRSCVTNAKGAAK